jgi:hypothetical protein
MPCTGLVHLSGVGTCGDVADYNGQVVDYIVVSSCLARHQHGTLTHAGQVSSSKPTCYLTPLEVLRSMGD